MSGSGENKIIGKSNITQNQINGQDRKTAIYSKWATLKVNFDNSQGRNIIEGDIVVENGTSHVTMGNQNSISSSVSLIKGNIKANRANKDALPYQYPIINVTMNSNSNTLERDVQTGGFTNNIDSGRINLTLKGSENNIHGSIKSENSGYNQIYFEKVLVIIQLSVALFLKAIILVL